MTWGDADTGGDSSHVHNQLQNLQKIQATTGAFAGPGGMLTKVVTVVLCSSGCAMCSTSLLLPFWVMDPS